MAKQVPQWWTSMTEGEREAWLAERPHIPFVAVGKGGYWGRGQSQAEALKQLRAAGFSGRTTGRVIVYVMPPGLVGASVNEFGAVGWYRHPLVAERTDQPQAVKL